MGSGVGDADSVRIVRKEAERMCAEGKSNKQETDPVRGRAEAPIARARAGGAGKRAGGHSPRPAPPNR